MWQTFLISVEKFAGHDRLGQGYCDGRAYATLRVAKNVARNGNAHTR